MAKKSSGFRVGNVNYGRFSGVNPSRAANENKTIRTRVNELKNLEAETSRMLKADKSYKLNSGEAAYGKKTPSKISTASRVAGAVGRNVMRAAGPVGALVGMTTPVGVGSDKPPKGISGMSQKDRSAANKATSAKRPTSNSLNAPVRTSSSGSARPTSNRLNAPSRTTPSKATPSKSSAPSRPSSGPTSAPSRTAPSKANLGTSRFAKGGAIKRRKK